MTIVKQRPRWLNPFLLALLMIATRPTLAAGPAPPSLAPMLAQVSPGVVNISVQGTIKVQQSPLFRDPFFRQFFNIPEQPSVEHIQAVGSGVIFDAEHGYVLTNNHVIEHANSILLTLRDRRKVKARLIGTDPQTDVAVLKIALDGLKAVPIGDSSELQVGDYVVAIGDPFGVGQTATFGIVSALGRNGFGIEGYEDFIQTDASINPGNSGGALVNMEGQLVGINTAILSGGSGGNVGIGFAIPVNMAKAVASQLITHGKVERGVLGVLAQDLTPNIASAMGISAESGALISRVLPNSAAKSAGIETGDVVVALDGKPVHGSAQFRNELGLMLPGTSVALTILRKGERMTVTARLERQHTAEAETTPKTSPLEGARLGPIPPDSPLYGQVQGPFIDGVEPGSPADDAGLQPGDVIVSVDQRPVRTTRQLAQVIHSHEGKPLLLNIRRGDAALFITIG